MRFACALADVEAMVGNEREARGVLKHVLALDLERVHRDAEWLFSLAILSEACVALGEERGAARLCWRCAAVRRPLHRRTDRGDLRLGGPARSAGSRAPSGATTRP